MKLIILLSLLFAEMKSLVSQELNFYKIRETYLKNNKQQNFTSESDNEFANFKRWEYFMEARVYPSGLLPPSNIIQQTFKQYNSFLQPRTPQKIKANWQALENENGFPFNGYAGRVNCLAFHPRDTSTLFIGTPAGGLWKTIDDGKSWQSITDGLALMGISEIAIDPVNPDIMYVATGDKEISNFFGNPYSLGILKTLDGGKTWQQTGIKFETANQMAITKLLIDPIDHNIVFAAIKSEIANYKGIWRSEDGGLNWTNVNGGAKYDLTFNPMDHNVMYTSGYKNIQRSTDNGKTWAVINSSGLPLADDIVWCRLGVTNANPNIVFAWYLGTSGNSYGLYKSSDAGLNWKKLNAQAVGAQAGYDFVLAVSPFDSNLVFCGGQDLYYSNTGGRILSLLPSGHPDHHYIGFHPLSKILYNGNDGGIYKSINNGKNWANLNKGLQIFQYYRLSNSQSDPDFILCGAQDNGSNTHHLPNWNNVSGGDGMECLINYSDDRIYYTSSQYGTVYRYGPFATNFRQPTDFRNCAWVTPFIIHPKKPSVLYYGAKDIFITINHGNSWKNYSSDLTLNDNVGGGFIWHMAISESNPDSVLYACTYVNLYKTINAGQTWDLISSSLPTSAGCLSCAALSGICVHPENPNIVWVTFSGYTDSTHVYQTTDGGNTWINVSGTLPSIPINTIVYDEINKGTLYIGTDMGVFFKDSLMSDWALFSDGLPIVPIQELEIQYSSKKLRAATFGRGLWETKIKEENVSTTNVTAENCIVYPNPTNGKINIELNKLYPALQLELYNAFGIKIGHYTLNQKINEIQISDITGLIYYTIRSEHRQLKAGSLLILP